jgi:hypothetical protein
MCLDYFFGNKFYKITITRQKRYARYLIILAGTPAITAPAGTSCVTPDLAPTAAPSSIVTSYTTPDLLLVRFLFSKMLITEGPAALDSHIRKVNST